MKFLTNEATLFFLQRPETLPLWESMAPWLEAHFPEAIMTVHKTQITFARRTGFLFLSLPPRKYAPKGGNPCIQVSFGLFRPCEHPLVFASAQPTARRFTHHGLVCRMKDLESLLPLLEEAHALAI